MTLSQLYYTNSWLPVCIRADLQPDGELTLFKYDDEEVDCKSENIYDLHAVVCYIHEDRKNLVSIVNVGQSYEHKSDNNPSPQWYIFNDVSVSPVIGQEAVWFSLDWKVPCILYWVSRNNEVALEIKNETDSVITSKVFTESVYLNSPLNSNDVILEEEIPKSGKLKYFVYLNSNINKFIFR